MLNETYRPVNTALAMRDIPRFGHTRNIADATSKRGLEDYVDGVTAFSIFLLVILLVWAVVLLSLKFYWGVGKVGCAAGGEVVDVEELRSRHIGRSRRKRWIIRNWRVQSAFLMASACIPVLSFLLANHGLQPVMESLHEGKEIVNDIEARAFIGIYTAMRIEVLHESLADQLSIDLLTFCPEYESTPWAESIDFIATQQMVMEHFEESTNFVDQFVPHTIEALQTITRVTNTTIDVVDWLLGHDWLLNVVLVALNVINAFFLFGGFSTKNDFDYPVLQAFTGYLLVPAYCMVTVTLIMATCLFSAAAMANADFCSGGEGLGSPTGTFQEVMKNFGHGPETRIYQTVTHYATGCSTSDENLLSVFENFEERLDFSALSVETLMANIDRINITALSSECGSDVSFASSTTREIFNILEALQQHLKVAEDLSSCPNMSSFFEYFSNGAICTDSINGLTALFSLSFALSILSMIMLSTRAALFNPVIRAKRIKRREKEFEEYKLYMEQYYDTSSWKLEPFKPRSSSPHSSTVESDSDSIESSLTSLHPVVDEDKDTEGTTKDRRMQGDNDDDDSVQSSSPRDRYHHQQSSSPRDRYHYPGFDEPSVNQSVNTTTSSIFLRLRRIQNAGRQSEVIYYSSDSDSDDEESIAMSLNSSVSALVSHVWGGGNHKPASPPKATKRGDNDGENSVAQSTDTSASSTIAKFFQNQGRRFLTPARTRSLPRPAEHNLNESIKLPTPEPSNPALTQDPLNLGYYGADNSLSDDDIFHDDDSSAEDLFRMPPGSASLPFAQEVPSAPQKTITSFSRTSNRRYV